MLRPRIYSLFVAAMALMTVSCSKIGLEADDTAAVFMRFDLSADHGKALVSQDRMLSQTIMMYDIHNRTGGANSMVTPELEMYLEAQELVYDQMWRFVNKNPEGGYIDIPWSKNGTHNFFAYNSKDGAYSVPVQVSYSNEGLVSEYTQKIRVGSVDDQWILDADSQFDFMYAGAVRDVVVEGYSPVVLGFRHAFAAVTFEVKNISSEAKIVNDFHFIGLKDKGYMTINSGYTPVEYVISSDAPSAPKFQISQDYTLQPGESVLVLKNMGRIGENGTMLMWPHGNTDFSGVKVSLTYKGTSYWDNNETAVIELASQFGIKNWAAGYRYNYLVSIADDNVVTDVVRVVDWINDDIVLED